MNYRDFDTDYSSPPNIVFQAANRLMTLDDTNIESFRIYFPKFPNENS